MENIVITIGREYGSGGKYIGECVAKKLNIPFYDKELLVKIHEENNYNYSKLEEHDEIKRNSVFRPMDYVNYDNYSETFSDGLYQELVNKTIKNLSKNSCVILGRNSNNSLKDKDNIINLFIYSNDLDFKVKRKMEIEHLDYNDTLKKLKYVDKQRKKYYESLAKDNSWGSIRDYDYLIDSSVLGVDGTVDLIVDIYNQYKNK